ncbi:hypothetical protein [Leisingera sp. ANG-Vp]|uniref:hypothetical protein n=1 Tax=Leisingera sp. ANG-Vp TaxID=1577896 RepID=UPI0012699CBC|nr:hypothetical protein [Leisingera sp. ANG-Vp]
MSVLMGNPHFELRNLLQRDGPLKGVDELFGCSDAASEVSGHLVPFTNAVIRLPIEELGYQFNLDNPVAFTDRPTGVEVDQVVTHVEIPRKQFKLTVRRHHSGRQQQVALTLQKAPYAGGGYALSRGKRLLSPDISDFEINNKSKDLVVCGAAVDGHGLAASAGALSELPEAEMLLLPGKLDGHCQDFLEVGDVRTFDAPCGAASTIRRTNDRYGRLANAAKNRMVHSIDGDTDV